MYDFAKILTIIERNNKIKVDCDTDLLRRAKNISSFCVRSGVAITLFSFFIAFISKFLPFKEFMNLLALYILFVGEVFLVLTLACEPLAGFWWLLTRKKDDTKSLSSEIGFHIRTTKKLSSYKNEEIELTKFFLQKMIDRAERRITIFFGTNSTCVTLIGLIYSLLAHFNYLNWLPALFTQSVKFSDLWKFGVAGFIALFAGVILGAFILKGNINRYQNKIIVLDFCLEFRKLKI